MITPVAVLAIMIASHDLHPNIILRGATIHDGTGALAVIGDVHVRGGRIIAVGQVAAEKGARVIDASGLIVAPGFIDLHTHSDTPLTENATRGNLCYLHQGVTTVVTGNCGSGPYDVKAYFEKLEKNGVGTHVIHLVPHNDVRRQAMGNVNRGPTADELRQIEELVDQGMRAGAWGLSTGLIYNPGTYAKTDELIALARVAAKHGGIYASHIREEGPGVLSALDEALRIGREANLPVHISHLKASGRKAWGLAADEIALLAGARKSGQVVTADQYPYSASSTSLTVTILPAQFREGSQAEITARLDDAEHGPRIRQALEERLSNPADAQAIRVARYSPNRSWQGKDLATIAREEKKSVVDVALHILKNGGAQIVHFGMNDDDVRLIMRQPFVATASDGSSQVPGDTVPHPRSYGTFPRKIGRFAIAEKLLPVEQAIRGSTGLPADILKLPERGYLRPGYIADIVVFDPLTFRDQATYDKPHQYATGVRYLFVRGHLAIEDGKPTNALYGTVLRHTSSKKD
jgi:N-acyl-D-aspartate/D-glutamate deacylase